MVDKKELRKDIWVAIKGVRIRQNALDEIIKIFGKSKAEKIEEMFLTTENSYQLLEKNFDKSIVENLGLNADEVYKMISLWVIKEVEYKEEFGYVLELRQYAEILLKKVASFDDPVVSGPSAQWRSDFMRVSDYAKKLELISEWLQRKENELYEKMLVLDDRFVFSAMELLCLCLEYVEDVEKLNTIFEQKKERIEKYAAAIHRPF